MPLVFLIPYTLLVALGAGLGPLMVRAFVVERLRDCLLKGFLDVLCYLCSAALILSTVVGTVLDPDWLAWWRPGRLLDDLNIAYSGLIAALGGTAFITSGLIRRLTRGRHLQGAKVSSTRLDYHREGVLHPGRWPMINQIYDLELTRLELSFQGLPAGLEGLRIGHLTDFHCGPNCDRSFIRFAAESLQHEKPDIILLTGDFVNFSKYLEACFDALSELKAPLGVYAIRGNHDFWVGGNTVLAGLTGMGFEVLDNRTETIQRGQTSFYLSGFESPTNRSREPLDFIPPPEAGFRVVMAHSPDAFPRLARCCQPDLVLSGHTHGGQVCFPLIGAVVVPSIHSRRYTNGLFRTDNSRLYVSRGIGCYPPLRTLCPPETTVITLTGIQDTKQEPTS